MISIEKKKKKEIRVTVKVFIRYKRHVSLSLTSHQCVIVLLNEDQHDT